MSSANSVRLLRLGNTTESIPVIGQGTGGLGGYFNPDLSSDRKFIEGLRFGLDLGLKFIDTAEIYGGGHTEQLIGQAIAGRRSEVIIATKFSPENSHPQEIIKSAENSLRRLNIDYIDLYQTHWPNSSVPFIETLHAMRSLVERGIVRWLGLCNPTIDDLLVAVKFLGADILVSVQSEYNLLERSVENQLLGLCDKYNLTFIAYSPLLKGRSIQEHRSFAQMVEISLRYQSSISTLTLAWLVAQSKVVAIPRSLQPNHIKENAAAGMLQLDPTDIGIISGLFEPNILLVQTDIIDVIPAVDRNVYTTLEQAKLNKDNMVPSPLEIAEQFLRGEIPKPIKLRKLENGRFALIEGRLKYWGWVIAFGRVRPIPAVIEV